MFSNHARLKKHTPVNGIDRKEYIGLLVDEFYETNDIEAQEQVTANLANFAYDPINYEFLKSSSAVALFLELLDHTNPKLILHGIAGLCNLCLDPECQQALLLANGIENIAKLLRRNEPNILLNALSTLLQLIDIPEVKQKLISLNILEHLKTLENSGNVCIKKLSIAFGEEFKSSIAEKQ